MKKMKYLALVSVLGLSLVTGCKKDPAPVEPDVDIVTPEVDAPENNETEPKVDKNEDVEDIALDEDALELEEPAEAETDADLEIDVEGEIIEE